MNRRIQIHTVPGIAIAILLVLFSGVKASDPNPSRLNRILTNDVRINDDTGTAGQSSPVLAMHRHGPLVIAWPDSRNGGMDIYFQRFGRKGTPDGVNTKVNDDLHTDQYTQCDAAMDKEGHFIIAFSGGPPTGQQHVFTQRYMANSSKVGVNVRVDDGPDDYSSVSPAVAACDLGKSVVAWVDTRNDSKGDIWIQRFDRDGARLGSNIGIAVTRDSSQIMPAVGMDVPGNFVLVWQDGVVRSRVMARLFDLGGTAKGAEFQVSPQAGDGIAISFGPALAVSRNGGFVVFWMARTSGGEILRQARQFNADGQAITDVFRVDEPGKFTYLSDLAVAVHPRGGFLAFAWSGNESGDWNIYSRSASTLGVFSLPSAAVNDKPGVQLGCKVEVDNVGNTLYAWEDNRNGNFDVYAAGTTPKRPNNVTAGSGYNGMVPLTWEPWYGQNIRTQYRIYRTESPETAPVVIATVDPNARPYPDRMLDFIDTTTENGRTYYYGVANVVEGTSGPTYVEAVTPSATEHQIQSAWSTVNPTLDGVLSSGEWDDAVKIRMMNPDALHGVWLYVKNSSGVLYAAVDDSNDMALEPATSFALFFDLDHDGKWDTTSPSREGAVALTSAAAAFQGCRGAYPNGLGLDAVKTASGILQSFSATSGHVQYEVAIDLASSPVKTSTGSTIGAGFRVWDPGNFYGYHYANAGEWPEGSLWDAAETLGDLILATEGEATPGVFTVTNTEDGGPGSLRQAILNANDHEGPDSIVFDIPETGVVFNSQCWFIEPVSDLPALTDDGTIIDGTTQAVRHGETNANGPEIYLFGYQARNGSPVSRGLTLQSSNNVVRGLIVSCFEQTGIVISGAQARFNRIEGNYIGPNFSGSDTIEARNGSGIEILDGASRNTVGGTSAEERNLISGNRNEGVNIMFADSNRVIGNDIGTDRDGNRPLENGRTGIRIIDASDNEIGGPADGEGNLISGNAYSGIAIHGENAASNAVAGNLIGVDATGVHVLGNSEQGVRIESGAKRNRIGGGLEGEGNVISGNGRHGVLLTETGTDENIVVGNAVGTDAGGVASLGNGWDGIHLDGGCRKTAIGPDNLIAYNGNHGIYIQGENTLFNTLTQNSIYSNQEAGIEIAGGGNLELLPPVLSGLNHVSGTAVPNGTVEIFSDSTDEGRMYEGFSTADGSGNFTWAGSPAGPNITATVTDANGNTSGFSAPVQLTGVEKHGNPVPETFSLSQNHPNPFNPSTEIRFDVKERCHVILKVLDPLGREVAIVADAQYNAGRHSVQFNASGLPSGIYLYRIWMGDYTASRKMVLSR